MCQFCGVDPVFAASFESNDTNAEPKETKETTQENTNAPSFFRLKKSNKRYTGLTTQQLTTFASSLSPGAQVIMAHHGEAYNKAIKRWTKAAEKKPLAVVMVGNANDVSKTIIMAKSHSVPFTVKCGGHSPSGQSNIDNGIVIDLGLLKQVTVNPDDKTIIAGGGCLAEDIVKAAGEYGLACVVGSSSHVGIGGFLLHGGYGQLAGEYGLGVDNIEAAEVVTANGEIVWASKDSNPDLFWAIRGAGNRFGVVTKFVLKVHKISDSVWSGVLSYTGDKLESLVKAINTWYAKKDPKAAFIMVLGKGPDGKAGVVILPFYNGSQEQAEASFADFLAIEPAMRDTSSMPYWKSCTLGNEPGTYTSDYIRFESANVKPHLDYGHLKHLLSLLDELYATVPTSDKSNVVLAVFQPDAVQKHERTDMAFCWRDANFDVGVGARWQDPSQSQTMEKWGSKLQQAVLENGNSERMYSNHSDFKGPSSREFGINYLKLCELKQKWDPQGVFKSIVN
ncbi:hypothetical protein CLU79DRAFT_727624 [Phycomyces nitens]|nr:hypothetical protein CLU79DRAFT_727624 [Phycomyces nitens]